MTPSDLKAELRASFERQGLLVPAQPYRKPKRLYVRPKVEFAAKLCDTCNEPLESQGVRHPWCSHRVKERHRLDQQKRRYHAKRRKLNYDPAAIDEAERAA